MPDNAAAAHPQGDAAVDADEELPWSHLIAADGKSLLVGEFEPGEKRFFEEYADLCPGEFANFTSKKWGHVETRTGAAKKSGKKGSGKKGSGRGVVRIPMPYDFFKIRTLLAKFGRLALSQYQKEHGKSKPPEEMTGEEGIDLYFSQQRSDTHLVNEAMSVEHHRLRKLEGFATPGSTQPGRFKKYVKWLAPFEKKWRFEPMTSDPARPVSTGGADIGALEAIFALSVATVRNAMSAAVKQFADTLVTLDNDGQEPDARERIKQAVTVLRNTDADGNGDDDDDGDVSGQPFYDKGESLAILGVNRSGKSFNKNAIVRGTEVSDRMYNLGVKDGLQWRFNATPTATDAARKVAKSLCNEIDKPNETVEDRETRFEHIAKSIVDLDVISGGHIITDVDPATLTRECPSSQRGVRWVLPTGPDENREAAAREADGHKGLTSTDADSAFAKCRGENVFDEFGVLNPQCKVQDYQLQKKKFQEDAEELKSYAVKTKDALNNARSAGDFLFPSKHSSTTVTARRSKASGGKQYAWIARFVSEHDIAAMIERICQYEDNNCGSEEDYKLDKQCLATVLTMLKYGPEQQSDVDDRAAGTVPERDAWQDKAKKKPRAKGSAFDWWNEEVPRLAREFAESRFGRRFDVWRGITKGHMPSDCWGCNDLFDRSQRRIKLLEALASLQFQSGEDANKWIKEAWKDDSKAFDWLTAPGAISRVRHDGVYRAIFTEWSRGELGSNLDERFDMLYDVPFGDVRRVGVSRTDAIIEAATLWLREVLHKDTRELFGATQIHQGAGIHVVDDHAYLKVIQDRALTKGSVSAALVEETRWIVPSAAFDFDDPNDFCELVDLPGLGDMDPTKTSHTRRAIRDASSVIVFAKQNLSGQADTLGTMSDLGLTKDLIFWEHLSIFKSVAIVLNKECDYDKFHALPAEDDKSILHREPGGDFKVDRLSREDIAETRKQLELEVENLADDDGKIPGVHPPAVHGDDATALPFVRPLIRSAVNESNHFTIYPALFAGLAATPVGEGIFSRQSLSTMRDKTAMPELIRWIRMQFHRNKGISSQQAIGLLEKCKALQRQGNIKFATAPKEAVPSCVRDAAETLLQQQFRTATVRCTADGFIRSYFAPLKELEGPFASQTRQWAVEQADKIIVDMSIDIPHPKGCYKGLHQGDRGVFSIFVKCIRGAIRGSLTTCDEEVLTKALWECCDPWLRPERLWDTAGGWHKSMADSALHELFDKVFEPDISERLRAAMSDAEAGEHGAIIKRVAADYLPEGFCVKTKIMGKLKKAVDSHVRPPSGKLKKGNMDAFKTGTNLSRTVLDKLAQTIFAGFPQDVLNGKDVGKLKSELDKRFSKESLTANVRGTLINLLESESKKLVEDIERIFLGTYFGNTVMGQTRRDNKQHHHTKSAFKHVLTSIASANARVAPDDESTKCQLRARFDNTLAALSVACEQLEKAEEHDANVIDACCTQLGRVDGLQLSKELHDKMKRFDGERDNDNPSLAPCDCFTADGLEKHDGAALAAAGEAAGEASAGAASASVSSDALHAALTVRFGQRLNRLLDAHDVREPHPSCQGKEQLASLIIQALGVGVGDDDHKDIALQMQLRLQLDCVVMHLDSTIEGMIRSLVRTHAVTVFVHSRCDKNDGHIWRGSPATSSKHVLRFVFDGATGALYLLWPRARKRRAATPDMVECIDASGRRSTEPVVDDQYSLSDEAQAAFRLRRDEQERILKKRPDLAGAPCHRRSSKVRKVVEAKRQRGEPVTRQDKAFLPSDFEGPFPVTALSNSRKVPGGKERKKRALDDSRGVAASAGAAGATNADAASAGAASANGASGRRVERRTVQAHPRVRDGNDSNDNDPFEFRE